MAESPVGLVIIMLLPPSSHQFVVLVLPISMWRPADRGAVVPIPTRPY